MIQTLYKKSKNGKIQQWTIEVRFEKFRTTEGYIDGTLTPTEWTICKGKRSGAANATTPEQQAIKEAQAKVKKQRDKGWADTIESIEAAAPKIKPMLAFDISKYIDDLESWDTVYVQPKLDGIRCIATRDGLFTRNGKPIPTAPHIWEEAKELVEWLSHYMGQDVKIDGELYNHELKEDFNEITSIVRKQSPTELDLEKSKKLLEYHIYDMDVRDVKMGERMDDLLHALENVNNKYLIPVETILIQNTEEQRAAYFAEYLEQGFEGMMIRNPESYYDNFRSRNLLKYKEFETEEFEIVDIEEGVGNRSGMMGRIKFKIPYRNTEVTFDSNARGSHEFFKDLLINKNQYIGKMATVRFQNYTPANFAIDEETGETVDIGTKPRFPVMIAIRDYE